MEQITLANLASKSAQEVFDYVAHHLLTQKRQSVSVDNSVCAYRGKNGLKCAAGCLIADDEYNINFEGYDWYILASQLDVKSHVRLITELQTIHDGGGSPMYWQQGLDLLAHRSNLIPYTLPS